MTRDRNDRENRSFFYSGLLVVFAALSVMMAIFVFQYVNKVDQNKITKQKIAQQLSEYLDANIFPPTLNWPMGDSTEKMQMEYTIRPELQDYMMDLLSQYKPDYASVVAQDATTGEIITMANYSRHENRNWALISTYPSASIFKVVTATAALDLKKMNPNSVLAFNGSSHTLYRRNVQETKENRWTRYMTLKEAFAISANTFFGKLGLYHLGAGPLKEYAERFQFNRPMVLDMPVEMAKANISTAESWNLVEAASGFTKENQMSPVHGAMIASSVALDGLMMEPYLVRLMKNESGEVVYHVEPKMLSVTMKPETAEELRILMHQTVFSGTSKKAFRKLLRSPRYGEVEFGGKTGSLMGHNPKGKTDWFVGYARFKDQKIAISVVTVHGELWRVKSSQLAVNFFERYLRDWTLERTPATKKPIRRRK